MSGQSLEINEQGTITVVEIGLPGVPGTKGPPGTSWIDGLGEPLPAQGLERDHYLDHSNGDVWAKSPAGWARVGNLTGPRGKQGEQGEKGNTGDITPELSAARDAAEAAASTATLKAEDATTSAGAAAGAAGVAADAAAAAAAASQASGDSAATASAKAAAAGASADASDAAKTTAQAAKVDALVAKSAAEGARDAAQAARDDASGSKAAAADSAAQAAATAAGIEVDLGNVTETADNALSVANGIDAKAQQALDQSGDAVTTANQAKATADGVDGRAQTALDNAATAVSKANDAQGVAAAAQTTANAAIVKSANLADVADKASARSNLGVYSKSEAQDMARWRTGFLNLKGASAGVSLFVLNAERIWLANAAGEVVAISDGADVTLNLAVQGVNGRDQAGNFNSQWVYAHYIWGAGQTRGTLASASRTAPILPAGYTHWAYATSIRAGATNNQHVLFNLKKDCISFPDTAMQVGTPSSMLASSAYPLTGLGNAIPPNAQLFDLRAQVYGAATGSGAVVFRTQWRDDANGTVYRPIYQSSTGAASGAFGFTLHEQLPVGTGNFSLVTGPDCTWGNCACALYVDGFRISNGAL